MIRVAKTILLLLSSYEKTDLILRGFSALINAVSEKNLETVKLLVAAKANVNYTV